MRLQPDNRTHQGTRYKCTNTPTCHNGITQQPVDDFVEAAVLARLGDPEWRSLRASGAASGPDPAVAEAKLERMWQMVLDGLIEPEEYGEAKARWKGEQAAAGDPIDLPDVESVRDAWDGLDIEERHLVFRRTITSLVVNPATRRGPGVDLDRVALVLID
jgi:hypothetical protein